ATQTPPKTAVLEYYPLFPNPHSSKITNGFLAASSAFIQPDGSYRLVVLPGPGVVCVAASPRNAYTVARVGDNDLARVGSDAKSLGECKSLPIAIGPHGRGVLDENKYNALTIINPDSSAEAVALDLTLQAAGTLKGTVVGPDGAPLTGVR